jgi:hypothetical protein
MSDSPFWSNAPTPSPDSYRSPIQRMHASDSIGGGTDLKGRAGGEAPGLGCKGFATDR